MKIPIFGIDAFTDQMFRGNPAAVCPLDHWLANELMQQIAMENNLSETAFFVGGAGKYALRWFTPTTEVDLCGHATLAAAWVIRNELGDSSDPLLFDTRSGILGVSADDQSLTLDFPIQQPHPCDSPAGLEEALGVSAVQIYAAEDYLVEVKDEQTVLELQPDFAALCKLPLRGVMVTAPGDSVDFVSRWFGPKVGVNEDPVTGSSHTSLAPYWSDKLGKQELKAAQISSRGGSLLCTIKGDRVLISGSCVKVMDGQLHL